MSNIRLAIYLQSGSLATLWLQLLSMREAQPMVLISLPLLIFLKLWSPPLLQRPGWLPNGLLFGLGMAWLTQISLGAMSGLLISCANLFWLLSGLKLLEALQPAAIRRTGLLLLLAIGMVGVFAQGLGSSLMQGISAFLAVGSLLGLELGAAKGRGFLQSLLLLVSVSLPLMVALFLLAPRIGPLWQLQTGHQTGLSDQLVPGSIASLVQNNSTAMRLQFKGMAPPPPAQRYWRVMALNEFDGRRWSISKAEPSLASPTPPTSEALLPQQLVLLEANNLHWLPWNGRGLPMPSEIRRSNNGGLWQPMPVQSRIVYSLVAAGPDAKEPWRQLPSRPTDKYLPNNSNPRLKALGNQWSQLPETEQRLERAKRWFLAQGFRYTLKPGLLPYRDALDTFLFVSQKGFCEHFAAAFTALMRAADVPARVVIGYQGGEWIQDLGNENGHLKVTQADAHAWSEVWLPERGWIRVDPTGWVVPSRLEQNLFNSLGAAGSSDDQRLLANAPSWMRWLQGHWQTLDLNWNLWVMQFDQSKQEELLRKLFGAHASRWQGTLLLASIAILLAVALVVLGWLQPKNKNKLRKELDDCMRRLGIKLKEGEPLESCLRNNRLSANLNQKLAQLVMAYQEHRFAENPSTPQRQLIIQLRTFRRLKKTNFISQFRTRAKSLIKPG